MRLTLLPLLAALPLSVGCASYQSDYVPPADGRARATFDDNAVVMSVASTTSECLDAVEGYATRPSRSEDYSGGHVHTTMIFWVPGPVVHIHGGGPGPVPGPGHVPGRVGGGPHGGGGGNPFNSGGRNNGNQGNGAAQAMAVIAAAAIIASPIVAWGLAFSRPEPEGEVASAIDRVNAYNDLARSGGNPCSGQ